MQGRFSTRSALTRPVAVVILRQTLPMMTARLWLPMLGLLVAVAQMASCGKTIEWEEVVRYHDGSTQLVERSAHMVRSGHDPFYHATKTTAIKLRDAGGRPLPTWEGDYKAANPIILERLGGTYYIVTDAFRFEDERRGCPSPPYRFWRLDQNGWSEIGAADYPWGGLVRRNVYDNPTDFLGSNSRPKAKGQEQLLEGQLGPLQPDWVQRRLAHNVRGRRMEIAATDRAHRSCVVPLSLQKKPAG